MTPSAYGDLVACLPQGRTVFRYGHGQFAPMLVTEFLRRGWTARELRSSAYGRLLDHDAIKPVLAAKGRLELTEQDLKLALPQTALAYRLTVSPWFSGNDRKYNQLSRHGCNLVLQLNFASDHDRHFDDLFGRGNNWLLRKDAHPMSRSLNTLAWARLDIDLDDGSMLIEEIQSDWGRNAAAFARNARWRFRRLQRNGILIKGVSTPEQLQNRAVAYANTILPDYSDRWQEKMMAACQTFAFTELGLDCIYMHTFETGNLLKGIDPELGAPPRSIYADLPKRMGFSTNVGGPRFLLPQLRATKIRRAGGEKLPFWRLSLARSNAS